MFVTIMSDRPAQKGKAWFNTCLWYAIAESRVQLAGHIRLGSLINKAMLTPVDMLKLKGCAERKKRWQNDFGTLFITIHLTRVQKFRFGLLAHWHTKYIVFSLKIYKCDTKIEIFRSKDIEKSTNIQRDDVEEGKKEREQTGYSTSSGSAISLSRWVQFLFLSETMNQSNSEGQRSS